MSLARTVLLASLAIPLILRAQSAPTKTSPMLQAGSWRVTVTLFRSPGTGLMVSKGHLAGVVGHYPTVIPRQGEHRNANFIRFGVAVYATPEQPNSAYASASIGTSLSRGWANSVLLNVGVRRMFTSRFSGQLGVAVLHAPSTSASRVNPTIGFGVQF